jgi:lysozyme family protein
MNADEVRRKTQELWGGLVADGDFGRKTAERFQELKNAPADSSWPPVAAKPFAGLTDALRAEYAHLWATMTLRWEDDHEDEMGLEAIYQGLRREYQVTVAAVLQNRGTYEEVTRAAGGSIPWWFVALIHNMECSLSFKKHLHNGDPLTARTRLVPAGRPASGSPPFTFLESAVDALTMPGKAYHLETDWTIPAVLFKLEGFNGFGYRKFHPSVKSPYLWSGSNHYTRGKYVADGVWSDKAVSKQLGSAVLLRALVDRS